MIPLTIALDGQTVTTTGDHKVNSVGLDGFSDHGEAYSISRRGPRKRKCLSRGVIGRLMLNGLIPARPDVRLEAVTTGFSSGRNHTKRLGPGFLELGFTVQVAS
jgi:hypothetical protein